MQKGEESMMAQWLVGAGEPKDLLENEDFVAFMLNEGDMTEEELQGHIDEAQAAYEKAMAERNAGSASNTAGG